MSPLALILANTSSTLELGCRSTRVELDDSTLQHVHMRARRGGGGNYYL